MILFCRSAGRIVFVFTLLVSAMMLGLPRCAAEPIRVAIVPYINSSGENRSVVDETISAKLEAYFQSDRYTMVPTAEVADYLAKNGYDATPMLLPERDVLVGLANATGANAVLAMDFVRIQVTRRYSIFDAYTTGSVSIYVKALYLPTNSFASLRIENKAKLTASRFGPGIREKTAIAAGIEAGMDDMFAKLPY